MNTDEGGDELDGGSWRWVVFEEGLWVVFEEGLRVVRRENEKRKVRGFLRSRREREKRKGVERENN